MNRILMLLSILITVSAFGEDDPTVYLEPQFLVGEWTMIISRPVPPVLGHQYFEQDTTVFQIYDLSREDKYTCIDILLRYGKRSYLDNPLGMRIITRAGGTIYCFLNNPEESMTFRDDSPVSRLEYGLVYDYSPDGVSFRNASFSMPKNDSLEITIGSARYCLKKGVPYVQEPVLP